MRLEFLELENEDKLKELFNKCIKKEEKFITFAGANNEPKKKLLTKNGRIYVGNNYSLGINQGTNGKFYLEIHYLGADDRIAISKRQKENTPTTTDVF